LKTLHLTNAWHAASGGIGTFYKALLEAANREGMPMRLVVPGDVTRTEKVGDFGLIYYIEAPPAPLDRNYRMLYPYRFLFPGTAIQRILNEELPDLVEISEKYTLPYLGGLLRTSRLPGVNFRPVVIGASHERMDENMAAYLTNNEAAQRFCRWYMKSIYFPMFDHHVTFSEHTAQELIEASKGHKVKRGIWVSPLGVDCDRFNACRKTPEGRSRLLNLLDAPEKKDATILLYVGRLSPEKNVMLLVSMMEKLGMERLDRERFLLCVAGTGTVLETMRGACAERGLSNVRCIGHVADRSALADLYANADVFVHPNPREPFGIAPLEAMAAGLPVIAPDRGGVITYANGNNAFLTAPDAESFAAAARAVRENPPLREARAAAGRQTAESHRWHDVTARFLNLYREFIEITRDGLLSPRTPPLAWTTQGDKWGREIPATEYAENVLHHS
jgi:alpha-1,6-mannosyltransferase